MVHTSNKGLLSVANDLLDTNGVIVDVGLIIVLIGSLMQGTARKVAHNFMIIKLKDIFYFTFFLTCKLVWYNK